MQGHPVLQVPDTQQGHEGQGEVGADTSVGPVVDGSHLEVVFTHPEGVLDLPQAAVLAQDGGGVGGRRQVGDDPVQAVPARGVGHLVLIDAQGGLAVHLQVVLIAVVSRP